MAAAAAAAKAGLNVTLIDEADTLGGQYFRGRQTSLETGSPRNFLSRQDGVRILTGCVVVDAPEAGRLCVWNQLQDVLVEITYDRLIVATGAYDRPVALPGWTLPGVMGAGGASTLAKLHGITPGKRILVAGAGPFILAVADDLSSAGSHIEICDATPWKVSLKGLSTIAMDPEIALQTAGYLARLRKKGVRRNYGQIVTAIHGEDRVEAATICKVDENWHPVPGTSRRVEVDAVCLGYGFVPQIEVPQSLGCRLVRDELRACYFVEVDEVMRTTIANVYAAGEITGTDGKRVAVAEGTLAGLAAAFDAGVLGASDMTRLTRTVLGRLRKMRRLANWIRDSFSPRAGLFQLADDDTMLCRCEDVRCRDARESIRLGTNTPYSVKTATRAGMGLCQGRICMPYIAEWLGVRHGYVAPQNERPLRLRPPLRPVPLQTWLGGRDE